MVRDDIELTDSQIARLEYKARNNKVCREIETAHLSYLGSQNTLYGVV